MGGYWAGSAEGSNGLDPELREEWQMRWKNP